MIVIKNSTSWKIFGLQLLSLRTASLSFKCRLQLLAVCLHKSKERTLAVKCNYCHCQRGRQTLCNFRVDQMSKLLSNFWLPFDVMCTSQTVKASLFRSQPAKTFAGAPRLFLYALEGNDVMFIKRWKRLLIQQRKHNRQLYPSWCIIGFNIWPLIHNYHHQPHPQFVGWGTTVQVFLCILFDFTLLINVHKMQPPNTVACDKII